MFENFGYLDSDLGRDTDDRKSTFRFIFYMCDTAFTWLSKKQLILTHSICVPYNLVEKVT
jgi:hypothetical protein